MGTKILINTVQLSTGIIYAGTSLDTTADATDIANLAASGGVLLNSTVQLAAAADLAKRARLRGEPTEVVDQLMLACSLDVSTATWLPALPVDGDYRLHVVGGVASWVATENYLPAAKPANAAYRLELAAGVASWVAAENYLPAAKPANDTYFLTLAAGVASWASGPAYVPAAKPVDGLYNLNLAAGVATWVTDTTP